MAKFSTLIILIVLFLNGWSQNIPLETAKTVATNWYRHYAFEDKKSGIISKTVEYKLYETTNFYIFSFDKGGFVMVSANNQAEPILGYDFESSAPDSITNPAVKGMFDEYAQQIRTIGLLNLKSATINARWEQLKNNVFLQSRTQAVVLPLLTTTWNQNWPYNSLCPSDASGPGGHVWAGCSATAMAQILKYHNYPSQGLGSYSYQSGTYPTTAAYFGATTYNWGNMPNSISTTNNDVATLIYQAAVSCRSVWGSGVTSVVYSSDTDPMTRAFVNYFRLAFSTIKYVQSANYTSAQWNTLLQTELTNNRPVYYRGDGVGSHAWVCDGVDASNLYHFNWGWGGAYNGYFPLTAITPGGNNFTNNQDAIIGIQPNDGSTLVSNTSWSGTVTNATSIAIPVAVTLTVNAGAVIKFVANSKLQIFGKILSTGTSANYATFTAVDTNTGWFGIKFDNNYMNYEVMSDNDTSRFVYSQIQYSDMRGVTIKNFSKVVIDHCKINNNYINTDEYGYYSGDGAGIFVESGVVKITNSDIYDNHAMVTGGGVRIVFNSNLSSTLTNNTIYQNIADAKGGGVFIQGAVSFSNNIVHHNQSYQGAGGALEGGTGVGVMSITNNKFCNNSTIASTGKGGGLHLNQSCVANVIDNLFANNFAKKGAALNIVNSTPLIINATMSGNSTESTSNISLSNSSPIFRNTISYGNFNGNGQEFYLSDVSCDPIIDHCDFKGGISGLGGPGGGTNYTTTNYTNNIDTNPLFVSPSAGTGVSYNGLNADWSLQSNSPCINAGDITGIASLLPALDLGGKPRITSIVDMGTYESSITTNTKLTLTELINSVKVYPNPVNDELFIEPVGNSGKIDFEILNSNGQVVFANTLFEKTEVHTGKFSSGIYFLKLRSGNVFDYLKIVKK